MDKLTAASILGVECDSSIEDVRAAFRAKTEEINLEDDPQEFALIQTAYRTLTKTGGGAGMTLSGDAVMVSHKAEDRLPIENHDPVFEDGENEEDFFAGIVEEESEKDRKEYERQMARETFAALLQLPKPSYDYVQLLEIAKGCDLRGDECIGIVKQLTTARNLIRRGDNRVHRTEGFDAFVAYLYSRMGKKYHPMLLRLKYLVVILIAAYFAIPAVAGVFMGFVEAFTGEMDNLEGMTEKVSFVMMMVLSALFVVGLIIILRKTREMRRRRKTLIIIAYIVLFVAFDLLITLLMSNVLK